MDSVGLKNKICDPQRHSFDFEHVLFLLMQTLLNYQHVINPDGWIDRQTDSFLVYIPQCEFLGRKLW